MAMLAHLLGIFTYFLGPLIIWLVKKEQSRFVDDQAKEALNFQIFAIILHVACAVTICLGPVFVLLQVSISLTRLVLGILATMKANEGVAYRYPLNLRLL
jgi:uncharacterized Tic20 family protein